MLAASLHKENYWFLPRYCKKYGALQPIAVLWDTRKVSPPAYLLEVQCAATFLNMLY